ncbi:MAG: hypothetical protein K0R05_1160 [Anaerocolumna sp.]|jgi:hypothetical protein|nr:hypothetical protein [Anaerocolumna sp.]
MFLSNLSAIIKKETDMPIAANSSTPKKHLYQSNRSFILNRIKLRQYSLLSDQTEDMADITNIPDAGIILI